MTVYGSYVIVVTTAPDSPRGNWHRSINDRPIRGMTVNMQNSPMSNESIGQRVRRLRVQASIEKVELARRVKVNEGTIYNMERGKGVNMFTFIDVARALGVSLDYLASGKPPNGN